MMQVEKSCTISQSKKNFEVLQWRRSSYVIDCLLHNRKDTFEKTLRLLLLFKNPYCSFIIHL